MNQKKIAIVGGGLSGLYAAFLLEQHGLTDYVLLEAKSSCGGRITDFSGFTQNELDCFDLGPTWFWPEFQSQLDALIKSLGLESFSQYEEGNIIVERSPNEPPSMARGFTNSPAFMRLSGGMGTLIRAIRARLKNPEIYTSTVVTEIRHQDNGRIEVLCRDEQDSSTHTLFVEHVFLALPPRLAIHRIKFVPALPDILVDQWRNAATWMAPHAKYLAVYDHAFWREKGLSGHARSVRGTMVEIHDASMPGGKAALFGFLGIPAAYRKKLSNEEIKIQCRAQMKRLFGSDAEFIVADTLKDWAQDVYTATEFDLHASGGHSQAPDNKATTGLWKDRLTGIGSEWSLQFPGYVAGAIEAATDGIEDYLS